MKRAIIGLILFCCSRTFKVEAQDQRPTPTPELAAVERLSVEVTQLRLELNEMKIELQQRKVSQAEEEMKQAQKAKQQLMARRLRLQQEIAVNCCFAFC